MPVINLTYIQIESQTVRYLSDLPGKTSTPMDRARRVKGDHLSIHPDRPRASSRKMTITV